MQADYIQATSEQQIKILSKDKETRIKCLAQEHYCLRDIDFTIAFGKSFQWKMVFRQNEFATPVDENNVKLTS